MLFKDAKDQNIIYAVLDNKIFRVRMKDLFILKMTMDE